MSGIFIILFSSFLLVPATTGSRDTLDEAGTLLHGISASRHGEYKFLSGKQLSRSTQAGIGNSAGEWVMRFDKPHEKVDFSHINFNKKFTGVKDPHIPVPDSVITAASSVSSAVQTVGTGLYYVSVVTDGVRLVSAINDDMSGNKQKQTPKVVGSIAGSTAGGYAGVVAGNTVGAWVGGTIGSIFGGVGAAPGAVIGSMIGGFFGGIGGSSVGSAVGEEIMS
ncbi:uncharacterized protein C13G5.2-like isoform X1 [Periplaneta americana]|uniref:uncharacterized protein C13G5.2-like isoform X1 n=1 Tax=Periplaneta americana TaxID=6978 RepID=UPI0037E8D1A7